MEYKAIQFKVTQTDPSCWQWIIFLDAIRTRTGVSLTRADAVLDAESAIDRALEGRHSVREASTNEPYEDAKRSQPGEYINLGQLMKAVLGLRLRVAFLEKVQNIKLLGRHSALNVSAWSTTSANGRRTRKAGSGRKAR
jgi:hypothetical protein